MQGADQTEDTNEKTATLPSEPTDSKGFKAEKGQGLKVSVSERDECGQAETFVATELRQELLALQRLVEKLKTASIAADPNPIQVSESELGETTLSYTFLEDEPVEIHVGSPHGPLLARPEKSGKTETGKWVTDGMVFFCKTSQPTKPLTREHTLATVMARLSLEAALTAQLKRITNAFAY